MCGIAGLFLPKDSGHQTADLRSMLDVLSHRGPNTQRTFINQDKTYQVAFARLAIIDLETAVQPIIEQKGERVLMGNGEIYNFQELRKQYSNYPFKTSGDIETILPLHSEFGEGFVQKLNGMFAIALYEARDHRLTLVRDRVGIKPLYWARTGFGGIIFASEIKALFASGLIQPTLNNEAVSKYIAYGYVPAPETLYRGVNKLPPGCLLRIEGNDEPKISNYWQISPIKDAPKSFEEASDLIMPLLKDSIKLQLASDVPMGALLSGGIDSSLMVALAAEQMQSSLKTFTVKFEGADIDETPLARLVSKQYRTDHNELTISTEEIIEKLPELVWYCEEPVFDASLLPNFLVEEALGETVTVILNGSGGDELFAGYNRYFKMQVEKGYNLIPRFFRRGLIEPIMNSVFPILSWKLSRAEKFDFDPGAYIHDHLTQFPEPYRQIIGNVQREPNPIQSMHFNRYVGPHQSAMLAVDIGTYLPEDLLLLLDRSTMASSVEGRVPFLDHRLIEAALSIPPNIRTPSDQPKGFEKLIAKEYLPFEILNAKKQGFESPVALWFRNKKFLAYSYEILSCPTAIKRGFWTKEGINYLFENPIINCFKIYSLLILELTILIHIRDTPIKKAPKTGLGSYVSRQS